MPVGAISHAISALAFTGLAVLLAISFRAHRLSFLLLVAVITMAIWAGVTAGAFAFGRAWGPTASFAEVARSAAWFAFLVALTMHYQGHSRRWRLKAAGITLLVLATLASDLWSGTWRDPLSLQFAVSDVQLASRLVLGVLGLMLIEDSYRNSPRDGRWAIKFLVIGLGGIFAYDFFLYANTLLVRVRDPDFLIARGVVDALAAPLVAVSAARSRDWAPPIHISRHVTYHSATFLASGLYLVSMAAVGYYVRRVGTSWGGVLEIGFLFGAMVVLAVILVSGRVRAWTKNSIARHFYSYGYDYREEWLRFIKALSASDRHAELGERIVRAVADIVEVPGGILWLRRGPTIEVVAAWNLEIDEVEAQGDDPFIRLLEEEPQVTEIAAAQELPVPKCLRTIDGAWIILPLIHHDRVLGLLVLQRPRAPKRLTDEDRALLLTVGRQAASYLAEWVASQALLDAKLFDAFNKRAAFIAHDLKNLVSQLSILVSNAERHRDEPEFISDMIGTVQNSVTKIERLLLELRPDRVHAFETSGRVDVVSVLREVIEQPAIAKSQLEIERCDPSVTVLADRDRLRATLRNLVENAAEAAGRDGRVRIRVERNATDAIIAIEDNGPGMDKAFMRNDLFRPFRSTKTRGLGIGAYESREFARNSGGRLEVESVPRQGTVVRLVLPAVNEPLIDERVRPSS